MVRPSPMRVRVYPPGNRGQSLAENSGVRASQRFVAVVRRDDRDPDRRAGNRALEIAWTAVPLALIAALLVLSVIFARAINQPLRAPDIVVTGRQWWWDVRARHVALSRRNGFSFYAPAAGWFACTPLSGRGYSTLHGMDYGALALLGFGAGAAAATVNLIVTILISAPGVSRFAVCRSLSGWSWSTRF